MLFVVMFFTGFKSPPEEMHKPDYSVTFFGFFHMCDLGVSFTFHFRKKITESSVILLQSGVLMRTRRLVQSVFR